MRKLFLFIVITLLFNTTLCFGGSPQYFKEPTILVVFPYGWTVISAKDTLEGYDQKRDREKVAKALGYATEELKKRLNSDEQIFYSAGRIKGNSAVGDMPFNKNGPAEHVEEKTVLLDLQYKKNIYNLSFDEYNPAGTKSIDECDPAGSKSLRAFHEKYKEKFIEVDLYGNAGNQEVSIGKAELFKGDFGHFIKVPIETKIGDVICYDVLYYSLINEAMIIFTVRTDSIPTKGQMAISEEIIGSFKDYGYYDSFIDTNSEAKHYSGWRFPFEGSMLNLFHAPHPILTIIMLTISIACLMLTFFLWIRNRKKRPKVIIPVEVHPPQGLSPLEMGYIIDGEISYDELTSMVFYYANLGYLTIQAIDEKGFLLHKENPLPKDINTMDKTIINEIFGLKKKANLYWSTDGLNKDEAAEWFDIIKDQISRHYADDPKKRIFAPEAEDESILGSILAFIPLVAGFILFFLFSVNTVILILVALIFSIGWYSTRSEKFAGGIAMIVAYFLLFLLGVLGYRQENYENKRIAPKLAYYQLDILYCVILVICMYIYAITICSFMGSLAIITALSFILTGRLATSMQRLTNYGAEITGRLLGFRRFIEQAEIKKLDTLIQDNPAYFYDILPYAEVLGLSGRWANNFEDSNANPPDGYKSSKENVKPSEFVKSFPSNKNKAYKKKHGI